MSVIMFRILEVFFAEKFTVYIQKFVFEIWYLWFGLIITISYLLVLQVKENRKLELIIDDISDNFQILVDFQ